VRPAAENGRDDIFVRVAAVLSVSSNPEEVAACLGEVERARDDAAARRDEARSTALDPSTSYDRAQQAQASVREADFKLSRLAAAAEALRAGHARAVKKIEADRRAKIVADADEEAARVAETFRDRYEELAASLALVLAEVARADERVAEANRLGGGLRSVIDRARDGASSLDHILPIVRLPDFDDASRLLWPPTPPRVAPTMASAMLEHAARVGHEARAIREAVIAQKEAEGARTRHLPA
jgi:hypothetical protein